MSSRFLSLYPDETSGWRGGASSSIPTIGAATSALDAYRIVGVEYSHEANIGAAFTDVEAIRALALIAEGPVSTYNELANAEIALQAILFHEVVHTLQLAPKFILNDIISYRRFDGGARTQLCFDIIQATGGRDFLLAPEIINVSDGVVRSSSLYQSPLVGRRFSALAQVKDWWQPYAFKSASGLVDALGVPAYFANKMELASHARTGYQGYFYKNLKDQWINATGGVPPVVCSFSMPPLLSILLDRTHNRSDILSTIKELRCELSEARQELLNFNHIADGSKDQAELERHAKYIGEAFSSIVPESRMSGSERFQRHLARIQLLVRSIVRPIVQFFLDGGLSYEDALKAAGGLEEVIKTDRLVDRCSAASTFADLIKTDSIQSLIKHHFSTAEINDIEKSLLN